MAPLRPIRRRDRGVPHGPITRLISPDELGKQLKPFIFLDFFSANVTPGFGFGMHPHSGIATLTWQPGCDVQYEDTTGKHGTLKAGGLEWMNAGRGAWHQGMLMGTGPAIGFQLWVPMPPGIEDGPSLGQYVPPEQVKSLSVAHGEVKVLLGLLEDDQGTVVSPIKSHQDMNYFVVRLNAGGSWRYSPPAAHDVAWAFPFEGESLIQDVRTQRELIVFEGSGAIELAASTDPVQILVGTGKRHQHPLVLGSHSVHTSATALAMGTTEIERIRRELYAAGTIS